MVGNNPAAINILNDVVFTFEGTTGGDDGNPTRTGTGSPVTFKADTVKYSGNRTLADHGTAQQAVEFNRITKTPESLTVETKLEKKANAALLSALLGTSGVVGNITATATGASIDGVGIVESFEFDYAGPSTLRFTMRQYGSGFTITTT